MSKLKNIWLISLLIVTLGTSCTGIDKQQLLPLELKNIPVNGDDSVTDPTAVTVINGFTNRSGNKVVESGDSITLLDKFTGIETPHIDWAAPYARGPVKVLYLTFQASTNRNPIELEQRSDFDIDILPIPASISDGAEHKAPLLHEFFDKKFKKIMEQNYDVIVIPSTRLFWYGGHVKNVTILEKLIYAIKKKVENGCGLLCLHNFSAWYRIEKDKLALLDEMSPITHGHGGVEGMPTRTEIMSPITDSFSMVLWPETSVNKGGKTDKEAKTLATVKDSPIIASGTCGKGRVAAFYYRFERDAGLIPSFNPEKTPYFGDYYEPVYALYLKAIVWVAGKGPEISLYVPSLTTCKSGDKPQVKLKIAKNKSTAESVTLRYRLMDDYGNQLIKNKMSVTLQDKQSEITPELPRCYANGLYKLYIWLENDDKIENWGCAAIRVDGGTRFIITPQPKDEKTKQISYQVNTGGIHGKLKVTAIDDLDRIFYQKTIDINNSGTVTVDYTRSCTPRNRIYFSLYNQEKRLIGEHAAFLYTPWLGLDSLDGDFVIASYGTTFTEQHLNRFMGEIYRAAGFNTCYSNWHSRVYSRTRAADKGLFSITGAFAPVMKQWKLGNVLKVCPNDPKVREKWTKEIAQAVDDIKTYGGIGRVINDENYFAAIQYQNGEMRGSQACQCPHCMKKFRQVMKEKYQTITKLNTAWGTDYKDFDSLKIIEEKQIKNDKNLAGWLEFRQYMNWTYANQYYKWIDDKHRPLGPEYHAGVGAPNWTSKGGGPTYKGGDFSYLKKVMHFLMAYGGPEATIFEDAYVGQPGGQKYDPPLEWKQHGSWYHLLNGADGFWYYLAHAIVGTEMAFRRQAEWMLEGTKDIRDGIGILVCKATPQNRKVRIFYSPENFAMAWLFAKRKDNYTAFALENGMSVSEQTFRKLFKDFNFIQPSYITAPEIMKGDLKDCKLLILPQAFNLSDTTAESIREYVKNGGTVVADVMPGIRSQMGILRGKSVLSDVFGIDASNMGVHKENKIWYSVGIGMNRKTQTEFADETIWLPANVSFTDLKPTTSSPQGKVLSKQGKEVDACFLNKFGKGKALLLNFIYCDLNLQTSGWHLLFSKALMKWSGVESSAKIVDPFTKSPLPYHPLHSFTFGNTVLLGSIRGGRLIWSGGRPILIDEGRSLTLDDNAEFSWREKKHIYNVRTRKYLGYGTSAKINLPSYEGRLLALLPYKVTRLEVNAPNQITAGDILKLNVRIVSDKGSPEKHVLRMNVYSPTGYHNLMYCKTKIAEKDVAEFEIPFADNDRKGNWTIVIHDVATGVEKKIKVQVK